MGERVSSIVDTPVCISGGFDHHWVIGPPDSETSPGTCTLCHASRDFRNFMEIPADRRFKTRMSIREGSYIPSDQLQGEFSPENESYD